MKRKSLGHILYPVATVKAVAHTTGLASVEFAGSGKKITIHMGIEKAAFSLVDLARQITSEQRAYALGHWNKYLRMRDHTGFKPPEGQKE